MREASLRPFSHLSCAKKWAGNLAPVRSVYFDFNATTPLDPAVRAAMEPFLGEVWGNPSSVHGFGRKARAALDDARYRLASAWRCRPSEVVFTSGGTESNNLAILGTARALQSRGRHVVTSAIEHHAVLHCFRHLERCEGFEVTYVPVDATGRVAVDDVKKSLRPDTILVSVMAANNEVGTIQPVAAIGAWCRERGVRFHTDAVQWFGKLPFADVDQFNADLVSVCAHKLHGPKGAGALFIRSPLQPQSIHFGGGHENERRPGTENLAAIAGLVASFTRFGNPPVFDDSLLRPLTERLAEAAATIPGVTRRGHPVDRLANTVAFSVTGCDSIGLLAGLDLEAICASSGSACSAGSLEPSHVLAAMGVPPAEANALVRFSLGRGSTVEEVGYVAAVLPDVIGRLRS
jgi:cysteine desulfurase